MGCSDWRAFATVAALILTLAAGHFFEKQMFAIHFFDEVARRERTALGLAQPIRTSRSDGSRGGTAILFPCMAVGRTTSRDGAFVAP